MFRDEPWVIFAVLLLYDTKAVLVTAAEPALLVAMPAGAALFAAWPVVAIDTLSFLLAAAATSMIKIDEPQPAPRESPSWPHLKALTSPIVGASIAMWARGGRTRRFTARQTSAWRTADQME